MKRAVLLFDLDGTLTDPREGITRCIRHALASAGALPPTEFELEKYIGPPLAETFALLLGTPAAAEGALMAFRACYREGGLYENRLYPGIEKALDELCSLAPAMFVATSKPREFAVRIVEHFGLRRFFRAVYGAETTGERSDKTELLSHLLRRERLHPTDVIMVGDRQHDIIAARRNAVRAVGVTWGFGSLEELAHAGPEAICASAEDLVNWYRNAAP